MDTRKVETRALSDDQLDAVAGGIFPMGLAPQIIQMDHAMAPVGGGSGGGGGGGGSHDPEGMFQQILQQLDSRCGLGTSTRSSALFAQQQ